MLRGNARTVGSEEFSHIQEAQIAYLEGQLAARRGDYRTAQALAKKNADLVAAQNNPRKMENHHDLMALINLLQRRHAQAIDHYRKADLTNQYVQYHYALALEAADQKTEAKRIFKDVGAWNFNSIAFALTRKDALARAGSQVRNEKRSQPAAQFSRRRYTFVRKLRNRNDGARFIRAA